VTRLGQNEMRPRRVTPLRVRFSEGLDAGARQDRAEVPADARLRNMNARVDHLLDEALDLPTDERSALVVALLESLEGSSDAAISAAWREELMRRRSELRSGAVRAVPWADAKARLSSL